MRFAMLDFLIRADIVTLPGPLSARRLWRSACPAHDSRRRRHQANISLSSARSASCAARWAAAIPATRNTIRSSARSFGSERLCPAGPWGRWLRLAPDGFNQGCRSIGV